MKGLKYSVNSFTIKFALIPNVWYFLNKFNCLHICDIWSHRTSWYGVAYIFCQYLAIWWSCNHIGRWSLLEEKGRVFRNHFVHLLVFFLVPQLRVRMESYFFRSLWCSNSSKFSQPKSWLNLLNQLYLTVSIFGYLLMKCQSLTIWSRRLRKLMVG